MSDDDWGMGDQAAKPELEKPNNILAPAVEEPPKEQKKEQKVDADLDQSQSWIVEKPNDEPDKKVEQSGGRGRGRGQVSKVTVEEKAEQLKPDKNDESGWGQPEKEKEQEKPTERTGRGRGNREGQEDNGDRGGGRGYNRNYQGQDFGGRGNRQEENNQRGRGNRNGGDGERAPRENGYNNGYRGNRDGGGERGERGGERGGDRGGDRGNRGGNWENRGERTYDRGDGQRGRGRGRGRGGFYGDRNGDRNFNQPEQQAKLEQKKVNQMPIPKGRKCWPECSIYIFGIKLCITFRRIHDFKSKVLVVPFKTPKLELYPGNIVNQSKVNYKEKIAKKEELKTGGEVYFQKAHEIASFQAVAFLKVDDSQQEESLKKGIKQAFQKLELIAESNLQTVVFCVSEELGSPLPIIHECIQCLESTTKVKQFYISTNSQKCFIDCIDSFKEEISTLFDQNEVSMQ